MRTNYRRRGRSTFLVAVLGLIALNLALSWKINSSPGLRDPVFDLPANQLGKRRETAEDKPLTIVFLGSSRTGNGVRPKAVQDEFATANLGPCIAQNLHAPKNGPLGQLLHWRRLLERNMRPDIVVIELILPGFADGGPLEDAGAFGADRMTWEELQVARSYGYRESGVPDWYEANLNPWFGYRFQIMGLVRPKWIPMQVRMHERREPGDLGWKPSFFLARNEATYALGLQQTREGLFKRIQAARFDGHAARAFRDLIQSCVEHGTIPIVYLTPESSEVRTWCPPEVEKNLQAFMGELRTGAIVGDGRCWLPDQAFSDGHHTVRTWADEYSRKLTKELVIPAAKRVRGVECPVTPTTSP